MRKYPLNLHRYDDKIAVLETSANASGEILLYGSSFFTNWSKAKDQMLIASNGKYHVLNHGFGGATVDELIYFYRKLVVPFNPKAVILRIGLNDIIKGFTAEETWNMAWRLMEFLRADYPEIKLILLCVFDYKSAKEEYKAAYAEFNEYQKEYAGGTENVWYLDINDFFYERTEDIGTFQSFRDVFQEDGLHLTSVAYVEFAEYLTSKLGDIL